MIIIDREAHADTLLVNYMLSLLGQGWGKFSLALPTSCTGTLAALEKY
jgi:hypothetical protein